MQTDVLAPQASHAFSKQGLYDTDWHVAEGPQLPGAQSLFAKHPAAVRGISPQPGVSQRQPGSVSQVACVPSFVQ